MSTLKLDQFEKQKDGRRTLAPSEIEESTDETSEEVLPELETKTELEPEDVDVEQLKEESSEQNIVDDHDDEEDENEKHSN